jgi:hypothetical protein
MVLVFNSKGQSSREKMSLSSLNPSLDYLQSVTIKKLGREVLDKIESVDSGLIPNMTHVQTVLSKLLYFPDDYGYVIELQKNDYNGDVFHVVSRSIWFERWINAFVEIIGLCSGNDSQVCRDIMFVAKKGKKLAHETYLRY